MYVQEGRMPKHLDHMREHVVYGTSLHGGNIVADRCPVRLTPAMHE